VGVGVGEGGGVDVGVVEVIGVTEGVGVGVIYSPVLGSIKLGSMCSKLPVAAT